MATAPVGPLLSTRGHPVPLACSVRCVATGQDGNAGLNTTHHDSPPYAVGLTYEHQHRAPVLPRGHA